MSSSMGSQRSLPRALLNKTVNLVSQCKKPSDAFQCAMDSLVQKITTSVLVVLSSLHRLSPDVSYGNPHIVFERFPFLARTFVSLFAPGCECIQLSDASLSLVEETLEVVRLFSQGTVGGDRTDKRDRVIVDDHVGCEHVVEQRVGFSDHWVLVEQLPKASFVAGGPLGEMIFTISLVGVNDKDTSCTHSGLRCPSSRSSSLVLAVSPTSLSPPIVFILLNNVSATEGVG